MTLTTNARWGALSLVALVAAGAVTVNGGEARADVDDITFDASTSAYGMEFLLANPSTPIGVPLEGSGPTASAKLSSLPQSSSFASLPYPGEFGATSPGLVSSLTGVQLPNYPFYAASAGGNEDPAGGAHFPGIDLTAKTGDSLSTAKATAFSEASGYTAESTISQAMDGSVTAVSTATQNGLQIGSGVTLSGVVSRAEAVLDSLGKVTTKSNLSVGRFVAPAMNLTLPDSFNPPNSPSIPNPFQGQVLSAPDLSYTEGVFYVTIPGAGPQKFPVPDAAVVDAFKAIGIEFSVQKAVVTDTGVIAPTLVMKSVLPSPPANGLYNGETPVTYTIGRTTADIVGSNTGRADEFGLAPGTGTSAGLPGSEAGIAGVDSAGIALPSTPGAVPATGPAPVGIAPTASGEQLVATQNGVELPGIAPFFFVLIIAAVLALAGGQALAYMGVRSAWKS